MSADGSALLAAAIRAAVQAKAPRRTVQAVAAAVNGVLVRPPTTASVPRHGALAHDATDDASDAADDPAQLYATYRAAVSARRKAKKERRRARKLASSQPQQSKGGDLDPLDANNVWSQYVSSDSKVNNPPAECGAAGSTAVDVGTSAEEPALAPPAESFAFSPKQKGFTLSERSSAPSHAVTASSGRTLGRCSSKAQCVELLGRKHSTEKDDRPQKAVIKPVGKQTR